EVSGRAPLPRRGAGGLPLPHLELVQDHAQDHADDVPRRQESAARDHHAHRAHRCHDRFPAGAGGRMGDRTMKRSNAPIFWSMFGAGGMLSALIAPALVLITGILVPLGIMPGSTLAYGRVLAFAHNPLGKLLLFVVVALFMWHAVHRIFHSLHDLGIHAS